jgi:hypothetical protein
MDGYFGFYRARVTEVDLPSGKEFGAVRVFIPDIMDIDIDSDINPFKDGLIAYPANSPVGGRNLEDLEKKSYYQGCVYVPPKGSYVWVFFERGCLDYPYYLGSFNSECSKLPVENVLDHNGRSISEPSKVFTILKTREGRSIIVSDDEGTQRIEICGKKRNINSSDDPSGNSYSAYTIDNNMTTILLDERDGKQKLLVRTYLGDFIHIDIDERKLQLSFENDINIKTNGNFSLDVAKDIHVKSSGNQNYTSTNNVNIKSSSTGNITCDSGININSSGIIRIDGPFIFENSGITQMAKISTPIAPSGERET